MRSLLYVIVCSVQDAAKVYTYRFLKKFNIFGYNDSGMVSNFDSHSELDVFSSSSVDASFHHNIPESHLSADALSKSYPHSSSLPFPRHVSNSHSHPPPPAHLAAHPAHPGTSASSNNLHVQAPNIAHSNSTDVKDIFSVDCSSIIGLTAAGASNAAIVPASSTSPNHPVNPMKRTSGGEYVKLL